MVTKIFKSILSTALIVLVVCLLFIIGTQYKLYADAQLATIERETYFASLLLENGEKPAIFNDNELRVTVIDSGGNVTYDNMAQIGEMENHSDRVEFIKAMQEGKGSAVRYSDTLSGRTIYYAVLLNDGRVLRLSAHSVSVFSVLLKLLPVISAIIIFTVITALVLATVISKKIVAPINAIDPKKPEIAIGYEELSPLIERLRLQNKKISRQISELTQSRREFEFISENMSEGILFTDKKGNIITFNSAIKRLFNCNEDLKNRNLLFINKSGVFYKLLSNVVSGQHTRELFYENGSCFEIITNPVYDDFGQIGGAVIIVIDATEKQKNELLRREFTANVSHELKTPLTSILGFSEILSEGLVAPEDVKGFGKDINSETKRLISLVNDIIKLSQLDEGAFEVQTEEINLKAVASEVVAKLSELAKNHNVSISLAAEDTTIKANYSMIFEMMYNLCDNAIKYNSENGEVSVSVGTDGQKAFIKVKDTGIGIPQACQEHIFERFYRVDKARSNNGGTGLGLSIVKHIVQVTNGEIFLESTPDVGTEITVIYEMN
ncbi:MAG: PAS domain-containing protein [Clostridia bacterium]|nr:PAS domain-containing protein [Clostridia bacterium]